MTICENALPMSNGGSLARTLPSSASRHVVWRHDDGEISMAQPLGAHSAALAFAGMWQVNETVVETRLQELHTLVNRLTEKP